MNRKKAVVIAALLLLVGAVFVVGLLKSRTSNRPADDRAERPGDTQGNSSGTDEIPDDLQAIIDAQKEIEKKGNMFEEGDVVKYGSFEYQVINTWFCDSYAEIEADPVFQEEGVRRPRKTEKCRYLGVIVKVTNTADRSMRFQPFLDLFIAQDGNADMDPYGFDSRMAFIGGFEYPEEDSGYTISPLVSEKETLTVTYYFEYAAYLDNPDGTSEELLAEEVLENPEYYIRVPNLSGGESGVQITLLEKDRENIYIRCYPKGERL